MTQEFQQQSAAIVLCPSPWLLDRSLPSCALVAGLIVLLLSAAAALVPIAQFLRVPGNCTFLQPTT